jgi:TolA-binding protein
LAVSILAAAFPTYSQSLQGEREAFEYAQLLYSDGLYDTAAEEYRRFILNFPTSERLPNARLQLAEAYFRADELTKSVDAYQIFVDRHPDNIEASSALRNRAVALERLSEYDRAAVAFADLYERFRTGEYAVQDLLSAGTNARKAGSFDKSERLYQTIITDHPASPLIHEATYNLGLVLMDQGRESEALVRLGSIQNSEREPDALLEIGRISLAQNDLPRAEQTFTALKKRFPKSQSAESSYLVLGGWYEGQKEWDLAAKTYENARTARLGADRQQQAVLGLARVNRATQREALQLYTQFIKVYPSSIYLPEARLGLGRAYVDKKQYRQAIAAFKRLQETFPDHPYSTAAHRDIGDVYVALDSPRMALTAYRRHLSESTDDHESAITKLRMGGVYRAPLGWTDLAIKTLSDLIHHEDPSIAGAALYQLGQAHEFTGHNNLAVREYRNYLERFAGQENSRDAERQIQYLSEYAPRTPVDLDLVELLSQVSTRGQTRLSIGTLLYRRRYFDQAIPHLESARSDTSTDTDSATFLLAEALNAISRRESLLGRKTDHREKSIVLYTQLATAENPSEYGDDAAFRILELQHPETSDTSAVAARRNAFSQFQKSHPASNVLEEARLIQADTYLTPGQNSASQDIGTALELYKGTVDSKKPANAEKASFGVGRALALRKEYVDAERALREFLFAYPNGPLVDQAHFQLGLILLDRGYLQSAAQEFAELLNAPTSVDLETSSRELLAECYFRLKDFNRAIEIDETLLARGAKPATLRRLGEAYTQTGDQEQALSALGLFVRRFPATPGADTLAFRRAELLAELGRTSQAIAAFQSIPKTFTKSSLNTGALASVARLQFEKKEYKAALAAISAVAAGSDPAIGELRIVTLLRLDRAKQARQEIKAYKKAFPKQIEALARFQVEEARVQLRYGKPKDARKALEKVIEDFASSRAAGDAEFYLVEAIEKVGKPDEHLAALISFVKNRSDNPHWARANLQLAALYAEDQDYVSASRAYVNALNGELEQKERPSVLAALYEAHRNLRLYDSAIAYARQLVEQYPHDARAQGARIDIGEIYNQKGSYAEAIKNLVPLLGRLQGDPWSSVQYLIAESYHKMGDFESGLREYLKLNYNHQGSVNWIANSLMGRAECFTALGRESEAIVELEKIKVRFPGDLFAERADQMIKTLKLKQ